MEYGSFTYQGKRYPFIPDSEWNGGEIRAATHFIGRDSQEWSRTDIMFAALAVSIRRLNRTFQMTDLDALNALELKAVMESIERSAPATAPDPLLEEPGTSADDEPAPGVVLSPSPAGRPRKAAPRKRRSA